MNGINPIHQKNKREERKMKTIYYNEKGKVDKFTTYINNHEWVIPVIVLIMVTLAGLIESF